MKSAQQIARAAVGHPVSLPEYTPPVPLGEVDDGTAKVIEAIFIQMKAIFPAWKQAWPDTATLNIAKRSWTKALMAAGICTIEQVRFGIEQCRSSGSDFAPSVGKFIQWCQPTPEMLGLPTAEQAYAEACRNAHPSMAGAVWSHDAVRHAATQTGVFNLQTMPIEASRKVFVRNYAISVKQVVDGQPFKATPLGLPDRYQVESRCTPDIGKDALAALRKMVRA